MKRNTCFSCFLCSNGVSFELKYFIILLEFKKESSLKCSLLPRENFTVPLSHNKTGLSYNFFGTSALSCRYPRLSILWIGVLLDVNDCLLLIRGAYSCGLIQTLLRTVSGYQLGSNFKVA